MGAPYGVRGWIRLQSYADPADGILQYTDFVMRRSSAHTEEAWQPVLITEIKAYQTQFIAKIADINTPEAARLLTHHIMGVMPTDLPVLNDGEYYWSQLVGLGVSNTDGSDLGVVDHLFATGSNDVLVIIDKARGKEHYVPYLKSAIKCIDLDQKIMIVDWDPNF